MKDEGKLNKDITDLLIKKILREIKISINDRGTNNYKLSTKIKRIVDQEIK